MVGVIVLVSNVINNSAHEWLLKKNYFLEVYTDVRPLLFHTLHSECVVLF